MIVTQFQIHFLKPEYCTETALVVLVNDLPQKLYVRNTAMLVFLECFIGL